jgi:T5SS/PEP-CTERM-associated repeat protein/autotransporter-associated beta strand protein
MLLLRTAHAPVIALALLAMAMLSSSSFAAINIWDGGGSNDHWTTGANWFALFGPGASPPNNGTADIVFPSTGGLVQTPIVDVPYSINSLAFGSGDGRFVVLGAAELTIGAGGITNNDADIQSVIGPVKLSANQTWNAAAGRLQMDAVNLNSFNLNLAGAHPIDMISLIVGTGGITVADAYSSIVTMAGSINNTYSGLTDVQGGTLVLQQTNGGAARVAVPGNLTIGAGGIVRLAANEQIAHGSGKLVTVNSGGILNLNGRTETIARLSVPAGGEVLGGLLIVGEQLNVPGGRIGGGLRLGDVTTSVTSGGFVTSGAAEPFVVGDAGVGRLDITAASGLNNSSNLSAYVGRQVGSTGVVTIDGVGSFWSHQGDLVLGDGGDGSVRVSNAGTMNSDELYVGNSGAGALHLSAGAEAVTDAGHIAELSGSTGVVTIDGANSSWAMVNTGAAANLYVGEGGHGELNITAGGQVTNASGYIGNQAGSMGEVLVDGVTNWRSGKLWVGNAGNGTVAARNGGSINTTGVVIGAGVTSLGHATIDGLGTEWLDRGEYFIVGERGIGELNVTGGAGLFSGLLDPDRNSDIFIGHFGEGSGTVNVNGPGSKWLKEVGVGQRLNFQIGSSGNGTLNVTNGGLVRISNTVAGVFTYIGADVGSTGTVTIDGTASTFALDVSSARMVIGFHGEGMLDVSNGGRADIGQFGSTLSTLHVGGGQGAGRLDIRSGGIVRTYGESFIGSASSLSAAVVEGAESKWITTGNLTVGNSGTGSLQVLNGGVVQASNVIISSLGVIQGNGNVIGDLANSGLVSPDTSLGSLTVNGDYTQNSTGQLLIELASASSYDELLVTSEALLAGTLTVSLVEGFIPNAGQSFMFLTADDVDGTFATEMLPSVPGLIFDLIYNPSSVVLTVSAAFTADFDEDGDVDGDDLVQWQGDFGANGFSDADDDGDSDGADFLAWQRQLGSGATEIALSSPVPEPAAAMLVIVAAVAIRWSSAKSAEPT